VDRYLATNGPYHLGGRYSLVDPYLVFWALLYEARDELFAACPAVEGCCELVLRRPKAGPILKRVGSMRADYEAAKRG
jgi:glutathione S-transferase